MDSQLRPLTIQRGQLKAALTRFKNFFETSGRETDIDSLERRLKANEPLLEKFDRVQNQIELLVDGFDQEAIHLSERHNFEQIYFDTTAKVARYITSCRTPRSVVTASPASVDAQSSPRFPKIVLPNFGGDYNNWLRFRDTFESLIHDNDTLTDIQRFHYLSSALKGPAAQIIQSLGVSEANYKLAWATLKRRFEDPNSLIYHHVNSILTMPQLQGQSSSTLRSFIDTANNHLIALNSLGEPTDKWDTLIVLLLSKKLDSVTCKEWEKTYLDMDKPPKFNDLVNFIEKQAKFLERATINKQSPANTSNINRQDNLNKQKVRFNAIASHVTSTPNQCVLCNGGHALQHCDKLKAMPFAQRHEAVKQLQCCFNCLQSGHSIKNCTRGKCRRCGQKHHTLLHRETAAVVSIESRSDTQATPSTSSEQSCVSNLCNIASDYTILSTAVVYIEDKEGKLHECRALLDVGSQAHFVTEAFVHKLGLQQMPVNTTVGGLGRANNPIRFRTKISLKSRCNSFQSNLTCLVIKDITEDMPSISLSRAKIAVPTGITLADPQFANPGRIDLLIGAGLFWQLLCIGQHRVGQLTWQKTRLGWVLGGKLNCDLFSPKLDSTCHVTTNSDLDRAIAQFWEIEEPKYHCTNNSNPPIDHCERHFTETTTRDADGRYIVSIPFNSKRTELGESRIQAAKRLQNIERRLIKDPELSKHYREFMAEYESLGHMTKVTNLEQITSPHYYLPHHSVFKDSSTTTKVRVVFDDSAKTTSGVSLNDAQIVGPTVQSDLFSILVRFRKHQIILSADIEKMYRQIKIQPEDRIMQLILWRTQVNEPIRTYKLNTVTYGTASAPFLATRVLKQIGIDSMVNFPSASHTIIHDFYVDDLLTGCDTLSDAINLRQDLTYILDQAGFSLRKWASNNPKVLDASTTNREAIEIKGERDPKTLGLLWSVDTDDLRYVVKDHRTNRITKRAVLSEIAQIFDPLGLIGPVITTAKLVMQQLWQLKVGWDESLPQELHTYWLNFRASLNRISSLNIPRRVISDNALQVELHSFSDASERAYGACVYLRTLNEQGTWVTQLLCSKSRVAPLKSISLPRLELCGALLSSQLVAKAKQALQLKFHKEYYWCDSTITLAWIQAQPTRWKTFIANRTSEIQELTPGDSWNHVVSSENPADLISRVVRPEVLIDSLLWWHGPSWLSLDASQWPQSNPSIPETLPEERRPKTACVLVTQPKLIDNLFARYSSYSKLRRIIGFCIKFGTILLERIRNRNNSNLRTSNHNRLTARDLINAEFALLKLAQEEAFQSELITLSQKKPLHKNSKLLSLNPFLDERGLIRVGGRLVNAPISYNQKHPVIVSATHPLTRLLINHQHQKLLHAGCQQTLASLRSRIWPINGRQVVKKLLHKCIRCFRANPTGVHDMMGNLPAPRVTPARAFTTCGVDYAGPFHIKDSIRARVIRKTYICVFTCFVTKAIHIELATDLSTDAFMNCLYRFIARRGKCKFIHSDNGTNFVGARNKFNELGLLITSKTHNQKIETTLAQEGIEWHLNPPYAPHFGGLWESAVKSTKYHLKRVVDEQQLTFEELYIVVTQIEACLNSRPLHPLSSDPNDLTPLTPGHFLIGDALTALPQPDLFELKQNRLTRYQLLQQMIQHFWRRWQKEYLHELQQRTKWKLRTADVFKIGTLVVIREDNIPPLRWRLGRIVDLHPGSDNVVRVVTLKVADGTIKRPTAKICVLPLADDATPDCH